MQTQYRSRLRSCSAALAVRACRARVNHDPHPWVRIYSMTAAVVHGVLLEHQHDITITEIRIHTVTADMHSAAILRLAALEIGVGNFDHFLF